MVRTRSFSFAEVSSYLGRNDLKIGLGGNIEEFADLRHVIPVESDIPRRYPPFREDVALPLVQFMIATHCNFPIYDPSFIYKQGENYVQQLLDHLEVPVEDLISNYRIVNPNYWGEPARIVRVALATARADGQTSLRTEDFNNGFEAIRESIDTLLHEVDLEETGSVRGRSFSAIHGRILRIIRKYGETIERESLYQELGVTSSDIRSNNAINELLATGRLYEPRPDLLKLV